MKPVILAGIAAVVLALACYTVAFAGEQRVRRVDGRILGFLVAGVAFDLASAGCMVLGSTGPLLSLHGIVGFSALGLMLAVTALALPQRGAAPVSAAFHAFFRVAYALWVLAFVSGVVMVGAQRVAARRAALLLS